MYVDKDGSPLGEAAEHVCEWELKAYLYVGVPIFGCKVKGCHERLAVRQAESRLSAMQQLLSHACNCDDAFTMREMHSTDCPWHHLEWAYGYKNKADILERK